MKKDKLTNQPKDGKKNQPGKSSGKNNAAYYNYTAFKNSSANVFLVLSVILFCLLCISLFKNISYPLLWADESVTAVGAERVLEYGYPKIHDGKNVFYDLPHAFNAPCDTALAVSLKGDAIINEAWSQFYFGAIGYKLAEKTNDIYLKTAIYRSTFAMAGLLGLLIIGYFFSRLFTDKFSRYAFFALFFLFELLSVSLVLILREVRYYSLVMLLAAIIVGLYTSFRFYKPFNSVLFACVILVFMWLLFNTFSPVYFIIFLSIGIAEFVIAIYQYTKSDFLAALKNSLPVVVPLFVSLIAIYPLLNYFKTFEISKAMNIVNAYNSAMYWKNVNTIYTYFKNFELLWLGVALKFLIALSAPKLIKQRVTTFQVSSFLTVLFIAFLFAISKIPNFIFTRYIIYLQPFLAVIIILDFFTLLKTYAANSTVFINIKMMGLILVVAGFFIYTFINNITPIQGHIYELSHQYKGPLDYTIPFIQAKYKKTDTLIVATNYEEYSYMYYLNSKVIVGYTGNNIRVDSTLKPQVISYRRPWGNYGNIFQGYVQKARYEQTGFPVRDYSFNNIPEFNFMPNLNHQFKTLEQSTTDVSSTQLFTRK